MMQMWLPFLLLSPGAWQDRKNRQIAVWQILLPAAGGIMLRLLRRDISLWILVDLIPGGILCGASFLCGGAVGAGDGLMLAVLGLCRGGVRAVGEAFLALILLILWGMIQIRRKKLKAKTPIAYLPFLWLADGIFVLAGG